MKVSKILFVVWLAVPAASVLAQSHTNRRLELTTLPDLNGNGTQELATLVSEPLGGGTPDAFDSTDTVFVRDAQTGATVSEFAVGDPDWSTIGIVGAPYGEGVAVGVLQQASDRAIRVSLYGALTGGFVRHIDFLQKNRPAIAAVFVPSVDAAGSPGIAVLAGMSSPISIGGQEVIVQVRRCEDGELVRTMFFVYYPVWDYDYFVEPLEIAALDDQNVNGSHELAVLARVNLATSVVVNDAATGEQLSPYNNSNGASNLVYLSDNHTPIGFAAVADTSGDGDAEIAVLGRPGNGRSKFELRETTDGTLRTSASVLGQFATPRLIRAIGDVDGNGAAEIVVGALRRNGRIGVDVWDGANATLTSRFRFLQPGYDLRDLATVGDASGNGIEELALIGRNSATGKVRIQLRDALTGERVRRIRLP